jgi:hypothetical protein
LVYGFKGIRIELILNQTKVSFKYWNSREKRRAEISIIIQCYLSSKTQQS